MEILQSFVKQSYLTILTEIKIFMVTIMMIKIILTEFNKVLFDTLGIRNQYLKVTAEIIIRISLAT
jgi:hypothetical protein